SFSTVRIASKGKPVYAAGIVGLGLGTQIENSFATGPVTAGHDSYAGGLAGTADSVASSFATGTVIVGDWDDTRYAPPASAGGLVGYYFGYYGSPIENSYSTGNVFAGQN